MWSLSFGELDFVQGYRRAMRAGLALQLVHFRSHGYFPGAIKEIADDRIQYVEEQLGSNIHLYDLQSDAARRHRLDILRHNGFAGRMSGIASLHPGSDTLRAVLKEKRPMKCTAMLRRNGSGCLPYI